MLKSIYLERPGTMKEIIKIYLILHLQVSFVQHNSFQLCQEENALKKMLQKTFLYLMCISQVKDVTLEKNELY